jgi:lipid II:glycine glycyltransferase (peptidoglycan interpeptide bridge formation enzyme)
MSFRLVSKIKGQAYDELIKSAPDYSILQTSEWAHLKGSFGWKPHFLIFKDKYPLTILERKIPLTSKSFLYSPHPYIPSQKFLTELKKFIKKTFKNAVVFKIEPLTKINPSLIKSIGLIPSSRVQPKNTIYVDIKPDEEDIMMNFHKKTRYNVRLAKRRGVEVKKDNSEDSLNKLLKILEDTADRKNFLIHHKKYYQKMHEIMVKNDMGKVFLAYYDGDVSAGLYALKFGKFVYYPYGASYRKYQKQMPSNLLHWEVIKWGKENNCTIYDLWGIPDKPDKSSPLWGIYRFKSGWGGEEITRPGAFDMVLQPSMYKAWRKGLKLWNSLRNFMARGDFGDPLG